MLLTENDNTTPKDSETGATTLDSNAAPSSPAAIERQSSGDSSCEMEEQQDRQDKQSQPKQAKVKQEPYDEEGVNHHQNQDDDDDEEMEERSLAKRPKMELVDAEANTVHTGESTQLRSRVAILSHSAKIAWRIFGWQN